MVSGRRDASAPAGRSCVQLARLARSGGELRLVVRLADLNLADLDLARLRLLQDRDPDLEDAVGVAGLDRLGVQALRQPHPAGERAHGALAHEELVVLGPLLLPLPADGQDPAVHGDLDLLGVDAGYVKS